MPVAPDLCGSALDGRYELHELIGEGSFGRVYRGRDRRLARAVAIKVIKPWWAEDPAWVAGFEREAQLLARVSHPGIVQIYDIGHGADGLYYVSELVDGESLAARLARGALGVVAAASVARQLCRALAHAHERGIIHRDVKPANVMLSADGVVKLGDFGVARLAEGSSDGATIAGTPRYMAPEQARGHALSAACDIYSVGVVLYEMLAGEPPFHGALAVDLALRHLSEPAPALGDRGVPAELERVVMRALAKAPAERFAGADEMARALERAVPAAEAAETLRARAPRRASVAVAPTLPAPTNRPPSRPGKRPASPPARRRRGAGVPWLVGAALTVIACLGAAVALAGAVLTSARIVAVPRLARRGRTSALARLRREQLHAKLIEVPAPGGTPGQVVAQRPAAGARVPSGSTVTLSIAQSPRWRYLTSLASGAESSARVRILGRRFRLIYSMHYAQGCTFLVFSFCSGPTVTVLYPGGGATIARLQLAPGSALTQTIDAGPGDFQLRVAPGGTPANWQITVEDYY